MKLNNPLITIITVVFNAENYLEQTIQSVVNQTYKNIEYLIIDGGSTDKTVDVIKKHERNITFWSSEPDKGIYDAMNKGIKKAKGEYIGLLNSDDYYEPDAVEIIVTQINKTPGADVLFGNVYILNEFLKKKKLQTNMNGVNLEKGFSISHPTVFVKREVYLKYGVFDLSYQVAADYELLLRFYKKNCNFRYINKVITNFREGGMSYYNKNSVREQFRLQMKHTTPYNAYVVRAKYRTKELLGKLLKSLLGKKKYHSIRYKFFSA